MRLLILGVPALYRESIRNFSGVWAHYLATEFESRGVQLRWAQPKVLRDFQALDLDWPDHVLALGIGQLDRKPAACVRWLVAHCRGVVAQTHDRAVPGSIVPCTFTVRGTRRVAGSVPVGWAGDPLACVPRQAGTLGVLVDHGDYVANRGDRSAAVGQQVLRLMNSGVWHSGYTGVRVRRIVDGAVIDWNCTTIDHFNRVHVPYPQICAEYGAAHVFMPTHGESVGLSVLETAMAGALPVCEHGMIADDLLATVRHVTHSGDDVDWKLVLRLIDVTESRRVASRCTWGGVVDRMLGRFNE